jgi:hypothetical protein
VLSCGEENHEEKKDVKESDQNSIGNGIGSEFSGVLL